MKSSFLLVLILLCSTVAWGQTRSTRTTTPARQTRPARKAVTPVRRAQAVRPKSAPAPVKAVQPAKTETVSKTEVVNKTSFEKFSDRLKIGYFGAYQGSSLGQWDNYALDEHGEKFKDYAHNVFNQVSFNYNFGWKMNFVVNPRFTFNTGNTSHHTAETKTLFFLEDPLVGFQGTILSSADKKFNWWTRIGARLPLSRTSRKNDITWQPESFSQFTYDFNKEWQVGSYLQARWWVYEDRYNPRRFRIYTAPYIQYTITDKDKVALWYENYSENRGNWQSFNKKDVNFQEMWQNAMVSYSRDLTEKINFMPFIGYFLNTTYAYERPLDAAWVGFWLSVQIK